MIQTSDLALHIANIVPNAGFHVVELGCHRLCTIRTFSWGVLLSLGANNPLNMALKLISVTASWKELFSGS